MREVCARSANSGVRKEDRVMGRKMGVVSFGAREAGSDGEGHSETVLS